VDGLTVDQLGKYLKRHWLKIRASILDGTYQPLPVRRKDIPKPDGGVRLLGIPAVVDRVIQQAIAQVLQYIWESVFSGGSFAFRPGRCQGDTVVISTMTVSFHPTLQQCVYNLRGKYNGNWACR